jgi:DNA helicase-2/ATP-dependent DNA helicase PcrA
MSARSGLLSPTSQQQAVIRCERPRVIVEANAGSAKTTTAALRVREQLARGTRPGKMLVLTYTQPGCQAVRQALLRVGVPLAVVRQLRVHTFDDFCTARLQELEGPVSRPRTPERVKPHVLAAIRHARSTLNERYADEFHIDGDGELAVEGLLAESQHLKGTMQLLQAGNEFRLTPQSAAELGRDYTVLAVYCAYEYLRRGPLSRDVDRPTFRYEDDATYDMAKMLVSDEPPYTEATHPLALGLELVVVDEMHDVNRAMFTVLRGLLDVNIGAAFVGVGDMDQVIHAEAGADVYFMREGFDVEAGSATRLPLDSSFRFGQENARMLGSLAGKAYASLCTWQSRVEVVQALSALDVRVEIRRALDERPGLQPKSPHGELAVLLRHPSRAVDLENELLDQGIDYVTVGFDSYLRRPEVLFVRGVLACALGVFDDVVEVQEAQRAVIHAMMLFAGRSVVTTMEGIDDERVAKEREQVARLANDKTFPSYVPRLLETTNERARRAITDAISVARSNRTEDMTKVLDALNVPHLASRVLVHSAAVRAVSESVRGLVSAAERFESIERFLHGTNARELRLNSTRGKESCIRLSTIEAAKGLEFDHVIVPDVNARDFDGASGDERNLFYVAASRARHLLTLTYRPGQPSSFLRSAGLV